MKKPKRKKVGPEYWVHRLGEGKFLVRWQSPKKDSEGRIILNEMVITDKMEIKKLNQMKSPYKHEAWPYVKLDYNPSACGKVKGEGR